MSPATMTTVDAILKEIYGPRIVDQLQSDVVTLRRIERTSDGTGTTPNGGKYVDFPLRVKRNHGMGYRNENEQLPNSGAQGYAEVHVTLAYGYGRVRFTGQVMRLARTNAQAFANAVDREMSGIKDDIAKDSNRIVYGDATGVLTEIDDTAAGTATHAVTSLQFMEEDMQVDILTKSTGAVTVSDTTVVSIDEDNGTVTFADTFTGATTLAVYRHGSRNREPVGFGNIIANSGALYGVDPANVRQWKSYVNDNSGTPRALSESLMIRCCDEVKTRGGSVSVIFTNLGVRRSYFNLLTQQRRYTDTKTFPGGFQGLPFHYGEKEVPVVIDTDAPPTSLRFVQENAIKIYRDEPWHWLDEDGSVLKWVHDYDAWEGIMAQYWQIGTERRNGHALLDDVIES